MILTPAELYELTRKRRSDGQRRELDHLGIPYKVRRDNSLLVLRAALTPEQQATITPAREPELQP